MEVALHETVWRGDTGCLQELLKCRIDLCTQCEDGQRAWEWAEQLGQPEFDPNQYMGAMGSGRPGGKDLPRFRKKASPPPPLAALFYYVERTPLVTRLLEPKLHQNSLR